MKRRTLILGGGGALVLGAAGIGAWWRIGYAISPSMARNLRVLGPKEYIVFEAIAARILHSTDAAWPSVYVVQAGIHADRYLTHLPARDQRDVVRLLNFVEHVAPLGVGHLARFTRLDPVAQDAVLNAMSTHRFSLLRGGFDALKSLCALSYFRAPETWPSCGYDGPFVARPALGWGVRS